MIDPRLLRDDPDRMLGALDTLEPVSVG
jgi:hypothetical protein